MNPSFDEARYNMIICVHKQGDKSRALKLFTELERDYSNESLKVRLGSLKSRLF